ncbi:MAG: hypothetical protein EBX50_17265 [Chitinophagia bacterium]|nr:hypothetical protein [Chitinophagia bacterium]
MKICDYIWGLNHRHMKIEYDINRLDGKFDLDAWLNSEAPKNIDRVDAELNWWRGHYEELIEDFKAFFGSTEDVFDEQDNKLTPNQLFNAVRYYMIRIQKLWLILEGRLYQTTNFHKESGVKYVVYRANWIDSNGMPFKKFSRNLGREDRVLVNGQVPPSDYRYVKQYISQLMIDLYTFEYLSPHEIGVDEGGEIVILD